MNFTLSDRLMETNPQHSDFVDAYAYMVASQEAKLLDDYVLLHLAKPRWMPEFLFKWLVGKFVVLNRFKSK
jgi:hypothetical protein